jgi:putative transposase
MTVRDIQSHLKDRCGVDVSPDPISRVTSAVAEDVVTWQTGFSTPSTPSSISTR